MHPRLRALPIFPRLRRNLRTTWTYPFLDGQQDRHAHQPIHGPYQYRVNHEKPPSSDLEQAHQTAPHSGCKPAYRSRNPVPVAELPHQPYGQDADTCYKGQCQYPREAHVNSSEQRIYYLVSQEVAYFFTHGEKEYRHEGKQGQDIQWNVP